MCGLALTVRHDTRGWSLVEVFFVVVAALHDYLVTARPVQYMYREVNYHNDATRGHISPGNLCKIPYGFGCQVDTYKCPPPRQNNTGLELMI